MSRDVGDSTKLSKTIAGSPSRGCSPFAIPLCYRILFALGKLKLSSVFS
jgi:hypothetical protein